MPSLACWSCGRRIFTTVSLDALFPDERRCPRCGALLNTDRRGGNRREYNRRQIHPTIPARLTASNAARGSVARDRVGARTPERPIAPRRARRDPATVTSRDPAPVTRLAVLGLGLIGGSVVQALAARHPTAWAVTAWSRTPDAPAAAHRAGYVAEVADDPVAAAAAAQLTLLAANPTTNVALVARVGPAVVAADGLLTDVTSVQAPMAAAAAAVAGLRAVGGHPMSGRERAGYAAADPDLFADRAWVIVPGALATGSDVEMVERLARDCGARPVRLEAAAHDAAVALISHLPLVVANALVAAAAGAPDWPLARSLAAQGWRDTTRLARGDPALGAGMLALNAGPVADALRRHRAVLDAWQARLDALAASDGTDLGRDELLIELERVASLARGEGSMGG